MTQNIAIIAGAGPAGLTTAYELLKRTDIIPIIFESTDAIGGIAQTYNYKGNRIDIGGHRFFSKSDRVMQWWFNILPLQGAPAADSEEKHHVIEYATEVFLEYLCPECVETSSDTRRASQAQKDGISDIDALHVRRPAPDPEKEDNVMLQRPRLSRIFYRNHFFPYPIGITLLVARRLGIFNTFLIGMSYIKAQIFPMKDETYLDAFYINRFGKRLFATFFKAYTEKVWGVPCHTIRADWGAQRVKGLSLKRAVTHALSDLFSSDFQKSQKERETSLITRFFYPKFGPGQMWEVVASHIVRCGGEIRMMQKVVGVSLEQSVVKTVTVEDVRTGERMTHACDYFFSTMPIKHLLPMLTPPPPPPVLDVARGLQYRDFLTVGVLLKKLHVIERSQSPQSHVPDNWIYIQDGGVRVGRVQIFNNWSPYMVADRKNTVWIGLEYFVNEREALWQMSDEDLIALGMQEMESIGMVRREDFLDGCVLRVPKAYPAYIGTYDRMHIIQAFVSRISNMFLLGRNGMHRYNNQDHSMLTAMLAVDNIVAGRTDTTNIWDVNLETDYHEQKKS